MQAAAPLHALRPADNLNAVSQRSERLTIVLIVLGFALSALLTVNAILPYVDEGMLFSPARNLVLHGHMGTSIVDETSELRVGMSLRGISHYTYQVLPVYFLVQAPWYKLFGFGLLQMRLLSLALGVVALLCWYSIVRDLTGNRWAALVTLALLATNNQMVNASAFGRNDMLCVALASLALMSYFRWRERNFLLAIGLGHLFAALSLFTHPSGILPAAALVLVPVLFDRSRIRWSALPLAAAPYVACAAGWGLYALQAPDVFREQLATNAANRLYGLTEPGRALLTELRMRYLQEYGFEPGANGAARLKILILLSYLTGIVGTLVIPALRRQRGVRILLSIAAANFLIYTVFEGTKQTFYLPSVIPVYAALLGILTTFLFRRRGWLGWGLAGLVAITVLLNVSRTASVIREDAYHRSYAPAIEFLRRAAKPDELVMGSTELAFGYGFDSRLIDDHRLGKFSGKRPDFIVVNQRYEELFDYQRHARPELDAFVRDVLAHCDKIYDHAGVRIYRRRTFAAAEPLVGPGRRTAPVAPDRSPVAVA